MKWLFPVIAVIVLAALTYAIAYVSTLDWGNEWWVGPTQALLLVAGIVGYCLPTGIGLAKWAAKYYDV